jgi:NADH:ubiquinone oxidoreductase subunit K
MNWILTSAFLLLGAGNLTVVWFASVAWKDVYSELLKIEGTPGMITMGSHGVALFAVQLIIILFAHYSKKLKHQILVIMILVNFIYLLIFTVNVAAPIHRVMFDLSPPREAKN